MRKVSGGYPGGRRRGFRGAVIELINILAPFTHTKWWATNGSTVTNRTATSFDVDVTGKGIYYNNLLTIGQTYRISFTGMVNAEVWCGLSGSTAVRLSSDGDHDVTITADTNDLFIRASSPGTVSFTSIHLYEL